MVTAAAAIGSVDAKTSEPPPAPKNLAELLRGLDVGRYMKDHNPLTTLYAIELVSEVASTKGPVHAVFAGDVTRMVLATNLDVAMAAALKLSPKTARIVERTCYVNGGTHMALMFIDGADPAKSLPIRYLDIDEAAQVLVRSDPFYWAMGSSAKTIPGDEYRRLIEESVTKIKQRNPVSAPAFVG